MGRGSIIKAYHHSTEDSSPSKDKECSCYKESCVWFLYAMITLSLGMAVLTFWLSLYREQEQRIEFINLEKSYNDTVKQLKSQLSEVSLLAAENKEERGNLSRELRKIKTNNPYGRILHSRMNLPNPHVQNEIKNLKESMKFQLGNLTQKINSIILEQGEYRRAIQDLSDSKTQELSNTNDTLASMEDAIREIQNDISFLENVDLREKIGALEFESKEELQKEEERMNERLGNLERSNEDLKNRLDLTVEEWVGSSEKLREQLKDSLKPSLLSNVTSLLGELDQRIITREKENELKILEQVRDNTMFFEKELESQERSLTSSKSDLLERMNGINERVDHFVRSILRLKNVPQEILLLNSRYKDISDRLQTLTSN